jgi:hypothetical protein
MNFVTFNSLATSPILNKVLIRSVTPNQWFLRLAGGVQSVTTEQLAMVIKDPNVYLTSFSYAIAMNIDQAKEFFDKDYESIKNYFFMYVQTHMYCTWDRKLILVVENIARTLTTKEEEAWLLPSLDIDAFKNSCVLVTDEQSAISTHTMMRDSITSQINHYCATTDFTWYDSLVTPFRIERNVAPMVKPVVVNTVVAPPKPVVAALQKPVEKEPTPAEKHVETAEQVMARCKKSISADSTPSVATQRFSVADVLSQVVRQTAPPPPVVPKTKKPLNIIKPV